MTFIKQNLFLVILASVTVVVVGVLLYMASAKSSANAESLATREELLEDLQRLSRGDLHNKAQIQAQEAENINIAADANRIRRGSIQWNRRNYELIQLDLYQGAQFVETIDAFPIQQAKYNQFSGKLLFTTEYLKRLGALRQQLKPVSLPSEDEIAERAARMQAVLLDKLERQRIEESLAEEEGREPEPTPPLGFDEKNLGAVAKKYAINQLLKEKANQGWLYFDGNALDRVFIMPVDQARDRQIWMAQVNLWITRDIVAAIGATIEQGFANLDPNSQTLFGSAVRRVVGIDIPEQYVTDGGGTAGTGGGDIRPPAGFGGPMPPSGGRRVQSSGPSLPAESLTGRKTDKDYEVIHYRFTVIMPIKHIYRLQENLMQQNLHTVLNFELRTPPERLSSEQMGEYYYGPDPVMEVTFECELLMFSAWTRGTPTDPRARLDAVEWEQNRPPLMPVEVLQTMIPESALRPIDQKRVEAAQK